MRGLFMMLREHVPCSSSIAAALKFLPTYKKQGREKTTSLAFLQQRKIDLSISQRMGKLFTKLLKSSIEVLTCRERERLEKKTVSTSAADHLLPKNEQPSSRRGTSAWHDKREHEHERKYPCFMDAPRKHRMAQNPYIITSSDHLAKKQDSDELLALSD
jgi:hypothetical protein